MSEEWKPGDRVQLMGTVKLTNRSGGAWVCFDESEGPNAIDSNALAAGKRLPRQFKVGDEVRWEDAAGKGPGEIEWPAKIEWLGDTQALVRFGDGMLGIIPLSELRPAPVKP